MNIQHLFATIDQNDYTYLIALLFDKDEQLLDVNLEFNTEDGPMSLLAKVISNGNSRVPGFNQALQALIQRGANLNYYIDYYGHTCFTELCNLESIDSPPLWIYQLAIEKGALLNPPPELSSSGYTPLFQAGTYNNFRLLNLLLDNGATLLDEYTKSLSAAETFLDVVGSSDITEEEEISLTFEKLVRDLKSPVRYDFFVSYIKDNKSDSPLYLKLLSIMLENQFCLCFKSAELSYLHQTLATLPRTSSVRSIVTSALFMHKHNRNDIHSNISSFFSVKEMGRIRLVSTTGIVNIMPELNTDLSLTEEESHPRKRARV